MHLDALFIGMPRSLPGPKADWTSSFGRRPAPGRVVVAPTGIAGDDVFNKVHHGGPDRVLLAYAAAHYPVWRAELPEVPFAAPAFGENLLVAGADEGTVCIGDVWRIGGATLQVSMPRWPCGKISMYNGVPDLLDRVMASGRIGWLLRVLEAGELGAGDAIELVERPHAGWTVARTFEVFRHVRTKAPVAAEDARALAGMDGLAAGWRESVAELLAT